MSALALDRQAIEKKDFPIARRGYEPDAVDRHLTALAAEVERLRDALDDAQQAAASAGAEPAPARPARTQSLALAASDQVRLIVEAAETSAADIERSAQDEAARIRADADTEARRTRDAAMALSEQHVGGVADATSTMLQRVDAMENELGALLESLRTGTNRLNADLSLLQGNLGDLYEAGDSATASPRSVRGPEPARRAPEPEPEAETEQRPEPEVEEEPVPLAVAPAATAPEPSAPDGNEGDVEGARLIALNMALNGQSRDETDTYLRENFGLEDRHGLLDEVYASVES